MATITDETGTVTTTPMRDIKDKDKTLVNERVSTSAPTSRGVATAVSPRSRSSFWATLSLVLGVAAALTALTGTLAGPAVALGVLAAFSGLGGIAATTNRHVSGKGDAMLGMLFGVAGIVVAVLAMTGALPWLAADADPIGRAAEWLEARLPWMFWSAT